MPAATRSTSSRATGRKAESGVTAPAPVVEEEQSTPTPSRRRRTVDEIDAQPKPTRQRVTGSREELIERKKLAGAGRREEAGTAFGAKWLPEHREQLRLDIAEHGLDGGIAVFLERYPFRTDAGCRYQVAKHGLVTK